MSHMSSAIQTNTRILKHYSRILGVKTHGISFIIIDGKRHFENSLS